MDREAWRATVYGITKVRHNSVTKPPPLECWYCLEVSRKYSVVNNSQRCKVGNDIAFQINEDSKLFIQWYHLHPCVFWYEFEMGERNHQFSCLVVSNFLWPHGLQHAKPPCPSPTPGVCSNTCPLSRWCRPTTSSSVLPFSCLQSFPASGSFQMSQLFNQVAKVLEFQLQHQSFQWIFRTGLL